MAMIGRRTTLKRQGGFAMVGMALAVIVFVVIAGMTIRAYQYASDLSLANLQGNALLSLQSAANKLVMNNYANYQDGNAVTVNGVTLQPGTTSGKMMAPTVAQLSSMDLGANNASSTGVYKTLTNANYVVRVTKSPAGCTSSDATCNVSGSVCLDKPVQDFGMGTAEVNDTAIGAMLSALGGVGGASFIGSGSTIYSTTGSWTVANPQGNVPGTVCAMFGYGFSNDDYLRMRDTRDPFFQGNVTVKGKVSGDTLSFTSSHTEGAACTDAGALARNADTSSGAIMVCQNGAWHRVANFGKAGAACSPNGSLAVDTSTVPGKSLICMNGIYVAMDNMFPTGAAGGSCTVNGQTGYSASQQSLICVGNVWQNTTDRMGHYILQAGFMGGDGTSIPAPSCGPTGTPKAWALRTTELQDKFQYVNAKLLGGAGGGYTVYFKDELGNSITGQLLVQTYCYYP